MSVNELIAWFKRASLQPKSLTLTPLLGITKLALWMARFQDQNFV